MYGTLSGVPAQCRLHEAMSQTVWPSPYISHLETRNAIYLLTVYYAEGGTQGLLNATEPRARNHVLKVAYLLPQFPH